MHKIYKVEKIEYINNQVTYTKEKETEDKSEVSSIQENYNQTLGLWLEENKTDLQNGNKSIGEFFETTPFVLCVTEYKF